MPEADQSHEAVLLGHRQAAPGASAPTWTADSAPEAPTPAASAGEPPAQPQAPPDASQGVPGAQESASGDGEPAAARKGGKG